MSPVIVDLFAGGGGASEGIRRALGTGPTVAINHDEAAILMHAMNHPGTLHLCEDLFRVQPFRPRRGRPIDLLWASPDCTHHSNAKGGKPLETGRRLLAWVVVEWARAVQPRIVCLENVREFQDWGPLDNKGRPIKSRKGETFNEFVSALRLAGYRVEWQILNAADYGAPTARHRLFMVCRCDGQAIRWPEPTHGPGCPLPWRAAAECIDWSLPCPSIFLTKAEAKEQGLRVKRPLEEATQRRIAEGLRRFVVASPDPYVVEVPGGGRVAPFRATTGNGERKGGVHSRTDQTPRVQSLEQPHPTICATGSQGALVAAFLAKHQGSGKSWAKAIGQPLTEPVHTVTTRDTKSLVSASLAAPEADVGRARQVAAFLTTYYGESIGQRLTDPLATITTHDRFGLVTVTLDGEPWVVTDIGMRMLTPRELAAAQGFAPEYVLTGNIKEQTARLGNSVCPPVAEAVVRAQFGPMARREAA